MSIVVGGGETRIRLGQSKRLISFLSSAPSVKRNGIVTFRISCSDVSKINARAAVTEGALSNGCPLIAFADATDPSGRISTATLTVPDARTALAAGGQTGVTVFVGEG